MRMRISLAVVLVATLAASLLAGGAASVGAQPQTGARFFADTGYSISDDAFWDYFQHRGGVNTFGQPVSRKFLFLGAEVQFFQRLVMQKRPDGSVTTLNLLDEGLMPVTKINGSTFPAPDPALIQAAPVPGQPDYGPKMIAFVEDNAPDTWNGMNVNFYQTFSSVVQLEDAFPDGNGDPALLPLFNLEMWGAPTSKPALDPANNNFVFQRFQRVIAHYDKGCDCTRTLLLADWFKSVITGRGLPADLDEQMRGSPFYKQYDLSQPNGVARPAEIPATNMLFAFEREDQPVPSVTAGPTTVPNDNNGNGNGNDNSTAAATATPVPAGDLGGLSIVGSELAQDPQTKHWIGFGEVKNESSNVLGGYAKMDVFDASGKGLASQEQPLGIFPLAPGATGTFRIDFGPLDGVDHQTTAVRSVGTSQTPVNDLRVSEVRDDNGKKRYLVTGLIENRSGDHVQNVQIGVSFYDKDKNLLDVWQGTPVFNVINDGDSQPFEAYTSTIDPGEVDGYTVYVTALRGRPDPKPQSDLATVSKTAVNADADDKNTLNIRGVVKNKDNDTAIDLTVGAILKNGDGDVVGVASGAPVPVTVLPDGTAPFELQVPEPPAGYDHVEYVTSGVKNDSDSHWPQVLTVTDKKLEHKSGDDSVTGTVKNDGKHDLKDCYVVVVFYGTDGNVVDVATVNTKETDIDKGDKSDFQAKSTADNIGSIDAWGYGTRKE